MAQVPAASYGLNILEVLRAPEKDLNQVVGMKKLAPYREDGGLVRPNYSKLRLMQVPLSPTSLFLGYLPVLASVLCGSSAEAPCLLAGKAAKYINNEWLPCSPIDLELTAV